MLQDENTKRSEAGFSAIMVFYIFFLEKLQTNDKYRIDDATSVNADQLFTKINKKYTKPGALLKGIRIRDNLTQKEMAKKLK